MRLQLEGFTAFRDPAEVDFDGAELFALVGPTGAGKSSIIDAIVFSLYGSVPRLDQRAVEPVIAVGRAEARVRFDFTIGDTPYTAVRVVRRQPKGGATTKEARLESGDDVLAGDARAVSEAAERVLGLGFEQFTKCVVLPQGEFARFLHDKPRDRQDLLVRLLELGVFERMRQAARARHEAATQQADWLERQLAELASATPEALAEADRRLGALEDLRAALDEAQPRLDALTEEARTAEQARAAAAGHAERLAAITVPADVGARTEQAAAAEEAAVAAERAHAAAEADLEAAEEALAAWPARAQLERLRDLHGRLADLEGRKAKGAPYVTEASAAVAQAETEAAGAAEAVSEAEAALEAARRAHAAHDLAAHVTAGDPCPVCEQIVDTPPSRATPPALTDAQTRLAETKAAQQSAAEGLQTARDRAAKAEQRLAGIEQDIGETQAELAAAPTAEDVTRQLEEVGKAEAGLAMAREQERTARQAARTATEQAKAAAERRDEAWRVFDSARDAVAALGPPAADRSDLAGAWSTLAAWAQAEAERQRAAAAEAEGVQQAAEQRRAELAEQLTRRCAECGVEVGAARPRDACADAIATATRERERIAGALEQAAQLRTEHTAQSERATVADALAQHLSARGFERWLLDEALAALCSGASRILLELSGGQYSLDVDAQHNFAVIDHRNADERRPARTLSGGETFLASLALALTLAEHLRELAVGTTPRLESIFLDEGFGTLDAETLDVVAATVEELGASGRTVGLVTHVRDLAERMPVRFEVRRTASGSAVDRVEV